MNRNPWVDKREVFDAEKYRHTPVQYEYPWDPTFDPQKYYITNSAGQRIDCEDGHWGEECYKKRWHPPDPAISDVAPHKFTKPTPSSKPPVPKGGKGTADTDVPPAERGVFHRPPPPGPMCVCVRERECVYVYRSYIYT